MSESDDEINRREVAYRLFAAEFDDADYSYAESDEERAPNYVVTPTGARVNRVFVVGVLTEVEPVNDDVVRARIVDPTGAFVVYAGQYQPEALASLEAAETPSFVAVTGKARTFEPEDADVIYTSIRPEHVSEVDAETRDRWVVATAEQTADRVATMAAARERVERGDELRRVLEAAGVPDELAAGIPLALDHYETSPAYLDAVRELALDAARVVTGDLEEVEGLSFAPSEGGDAALDFADSIDVNVEVGADDKAGEAGAAGANGGAEESADETSDETPTSAEAGPAGNEPADDESTKTEPTEAEPTEAEAAADQSDSEIVESADAADVEESEGDTAAEEADTPSGAADSDQAEPDQAESGQSDGEMYELSDEEREEVEENYDVGFSSGSDIPDAGEADIDTPESDEPATGAADDAQAEPEGDESELGTEATDADTDAADVDAADEESDELGDFDGGDDLPDAEDDVEDVDTSEEFTEDEYDDAQSEMDDAEAGSMELDLEDRVVDLMAELDDGDGAPRDEVIAAATDEYDADEGDVEDAIQSALMGGRCYEAGDDHLKAI